MRLLPGIVNIYGTENDLGMPEFAQSLKDGDARDAPPYLLDLTYLLLGFGEPTCPPWCTIQIQPHMSRTNEFYIPLALLLIASAHLTDAIAPTFGKIRCDLHMAAPEDVASIIEPLTYPLVNAARRALASIQLAPLSDDTHPYDEWDNNTAVVYGALIALDSGAMTREFAAVA